MLKKILGIMMAALFLVNAGIAPVNAAEVPNMEEKSGDIKRSDLEPGWVANIYAYSDGDDYKATPVAPMGTFNANKSGYPLGTYKDFLGFQIQGKGIIWQCKGYIIAEKEGYYVFTLDLKKDHSYGVIVINGNEIANADVRYSTTTVVGNIQLKPGIHSVEFRYANWDQRYKKDSFELRIKSPTDNAPVLAEKVLFRKK